LLGGPPTLNQIVPRGCLENGPGEACIRQGEPRDQNELWKWGDSGKKINWKRETGLKTGVGGEDHITSRKPPAPRTNKPVTKKIPSGGGKNTSKVAKGARVKTKRPDRTTTSKQ